MSTVDLWCPYVWSSHFDVVSRHMPDVASAAQFCGKYLIVMALAWKEEAPQLRRREYLRRSKVRINPWYGYLGIYTLYVQDKEAGNYGLQ